MMEAEDIREWDVEFAASDRLRELREFAKRVRRTANGVSRYSSPDAALVDALVLIDALCNEIDRTAEPPDPT